MVLDCPKGHIAVTTWPSAIGKIFLIRLFPLLLSLNLLPAQEEVVDVANPKWNITRGRGFVVPLRTRLLASRFAEPSVLQALLKRYVSSTSGFWILLLRIPTSLSACPCTTMRRASLSVRALCRWRTTSLTLTMVSLTTPRTTGSLQLMDITDENQ
jgi:hypothetical protein